LGGAGGGRVGDRDGEVALAGGEGGDRLVGDGVWMKRREVRVASTAVSFEEDEPLEPEEFEEVELDAGRPLRPIPTVPE
jgi:hypothetical protein